MLNLDQQRALEILHSGRNVFLSGGAGTGKSYLISEFLRENNTKNVVACAMTEAGAENIGGRTLNSVFGIPDRVLNVGEYNKQAGIELEHADVIVIDEINICRVDVFEYVILTLQNIAKRKERYGYTEHLNKQIILVGDFYQVPKLIDREERLQLLREWGLMRKEDLMAFNSALWSELSFASVVMKTSVQQSSSFEFVNDITNSQEKKILRTKNVVSDFYDAIENNNQDEYVLDLEFGTNHKEYVPFFRKIMKVNDASYELWNDEEDRQLMDEWAAGVRIDEIAQNHKRTIGAIRSRLMQLSG